MLRFTLSRLVASRRDDGVGVQQRPKPTGNISHGLHGFTQISSSPLFFHGLRGICTDFVPSERRLGLRLPQTISVPACCVARLSSQPSSRRRRCSAAAQANGKYLPRITRIYTDFFFACVFPRIEGDLHGCFCSFGTTLEAQPHPGRVAHISPG